MLLLENKKIENNKMRKIYNNLSIENLTKTEWFNQFNRYQKEEILKGLEKDLNVSIYAKTEFDWKQMFEIREKLLEEEKEKLDNEQENI